MSDDQVDETEIAQLRAERDALLAEVEALKTPKAGRQRVRHVIVGALVLISCIALVAASVGIWAGRNFLDTDRFVGRVAPLIEEPAVQEAVTNRVTTQLMVLIDPRAFFEEVLPERGRLLAIPLTGVVEDFVRDRVETFVASDRFANLWAGAIRVSHETSLRVLRGDSEVVTAEDGVVTINLLPIMNAVLAEITSASPEILGRTVDLPDVTVEDIPATTIARLEEALDVELGDDFGQFTVYDKGKLEGAQRAVELFERGVVLLSVLTIASAVGALWLSHWRRRTLLQLMAGAIAGSVMLRRASFTVQDEVTLLPPTDAGQRAAQVIIETFVEPITTAAAWAIGIAAVVAAVALITGPYPWAVGIRRRTAELGRRLVSSTTERAQDESTVRWIAEHRDHLLVGIGGVGLLLLWTVDLSFLRLVLLVGILGALAAAVIRTAERTDDSEEVTPIG